MALCSLYQVYDTIKDDLFVKTDTRLREESAHAAMVQQSLNELDGYCGRMVRYFSPHAFVCFFFERLFF